MAKQFDDTNRGSIGKNKKKTEPNHADITGAGKFDGKEFWINGWQKQSPDGGIFYSLSFREKEPRFGSQGGAQGGGQSSPAAQQADDLPF